MFERFVDRKDKKELIKSCPDFRLRRHGLPPTIIAYSFIAVILAIFLLVGNLVIKLMFLSDRAPTPNNEIFTIVVAVGVCIFVVGVFSIVMILRIRNIILETEFQNLIFASASRVGSDFAIIVTKDKRTVYHDYNFSQLFSSLGESTDAFNSLLLDKGIKKSDKDKILKAVKDGKSAKATLNYAISTDKKTKKYNLSVDPISRPAGYFLVRGSTA